MVSTTGFHQVATSVDISSWNTIATEEFKFRFKSAYQFCAESVFWQSSSVSNQYFEKTPIAAVFAFHEKHSSPLHEALSCYLDNRANVNVKSLSYASPLDCVPLQSADLVAYEDYRYWEMMRSGKLGAIISDRRSMAKLEMAGHWEFGGFYHGESLKIAVKRFHSMMELPDPYPEV